MRTKFLTLVALLVAGAVRADVVIEHFSNSGSSGFSTGTGFTISFTNSGTSATLSSLRLFGGPGDDVASFILTRVSDGATYSENATGIAGGIFTFTGAIASAELTNSAYTLAITDLNGTYNSTDNSSATTTGIYGFSGASQTAIVSSNYLIYTVSAVPEPGTMLLGGIAAAVGGAGAWWKRRKQRLAAAEAAATPA